MGAIVGMELGPFVETTTGSLVGLELGVVVSLELGFDVSGVGEIEG